MLVLPIIWMEHAGLATFRTSYLIWPLWTGESNRWLSVFPYVCLFLLLFRLCFRGLAGVRPSTIVHLRFMLWKVSLWAVGCSVWYLTSLSLSSVVISFIMPPKSFHGFSFVLLISRFYLPSFIFRKTPAPLCSSNFISRVSLISHWLIEMLCSFQDLSSTHWCTVFLPDLQALPKLLPSSKALWLLVFNMAVGQSCLEYNGTVIVFVATLVFCHVLLSPNSYF